MIQRYQLIVALFITTVCGSALIRAQVSGPFDVVYRIAPDYKGAADTLHALWWKPDMQSQSPLPLIVWIHGGAFAAGAPQAMAAECERWAQRGYLAVSLQYRLGYHSPPLLSMPYAFDPAEIVRACWRGMQDIRAGVRAAVQGSLFPVPVDTSCVILAGESAGAILAIQAVIADVHDSIPKEVDSIGIVDYLFEKWERPALGGVDGPFDDTGLFAPFPRISGIINRYGAIMHPYMLDAPIFPPLCSYQQRGDLVVPCEKNRGLWGMPLGVGDNYPVIYGVCATTRMLEQGGHPAALRSTTIVEGLGHELHDATLVRAIEDTFVTTIACPHTSTVPDQTMLNNDMNAYAAGWQAFDMLGRCITRGSGGVDGALQWFRNTAVIPTGRPVLIRSGTTTRLMW